MGGAVRELDRQVVPQMDDSGRQELGQMGLSWSVLLRLPTGVVGLFEGVPDRRSTSSVSVAPVVSRKRSSVRPREIATARAQPQQRREEPR